MLNNEVYCEQCGKEVEVNYIKKQVIHKIYGEDIEVEVTIPYCKENGCELSILDLEEERYDQAYNKYRKIKGLLTPEEIKNIREKYGLSQRAFSRVLGFSESTVNRYELGAIQDSVHNIIMLLSSEPANMNILLSQNKSNLSSREISLLQTKIKELDNLNSDPNENILISLKEEISEISKKIGHFDKKIDGLEKKFDLNIYSYKWKDKNNWPIEELVIHKNKKEFITFMNN